MLHNEGTVVFLIVTMVGLFLVLYFILLRPSPPQVDEKEPAEEFKFTEEAHPVEEDDGEFGMGGDSWKQGRKDND